MYGTRANPHYPNLRLRNAEPQSVARLKFVHVHLVGTAIDVNGYEFALVVRLELGTDIVLVNRVATMREFFFAVMSLCRSHDNPPVSRKAWLLYLSLNCVTMR